MFVGKDILFPPKSIEELSYDVEDIPPFQFIRDGNITPVFKFSAIKYDAVAND